MARTDRTKMNVDCRNCRHLKAIPPGCEVMPSDYHYLLGFQDYCPCYEEVRNNGLCEPDTEAHSTG